ncbi:F-box domain [Arabidopsis thaliana x Arabidopsis arenosa]|uniref:F-box domain n=1 Tax=Arabidopsis thaliana x Arabidopsis arenosa TaxID=1240361 RepID=A0A8T2ARS9_9BRAS|nr:F-box domain [Arabidopsis thaliana x Arabidopsis arenosa]
MLQIRRTTFCKDRISALPDDLLLQILCLIPTKDAVTTMILSKRWRFVWTMLPKLDYTDRYEGEKSNPKKSVWDFLDKSLQLHKAPSLERLRIHLGQQCPVDVDVEKWVLNAVERFVRELILEIRFIPTADPILTSLPKSLYTCKTIVKLTLCGKIFVDVPSSACLPSLVSLVLVSVVYEDQDSHVRLLSSCPVLRDLFVCRNKSDNVKRFIVKLPSLRKLKYMDLASRNSNDDSDRSLVSDSPGLNYVYIFDLRGHDCSIQNMPHLDVAIVSVGSYPTNKFLRSLSSVRCLDLSLNEVACCSAINFPRLIEFKLHTGFSDNWLEPFMLFLHKAPKLKALMITSDYLQGRDDLFEDLFEEVPLSWNQPSSVPGCLLSHLEIFEWKNFGGSREEKQFLAYILANSNCLKTVGILLRPSKTENDDEEKEKIMEDLESMYRVSASSQLLFSAEFRWRYYREAEKSAWICALPDDLLVQILCLIPTKDAVTTMILSKRWRFVWTMLPKLDYKENFEDETSVWDFLDKSLQLHKAPSLERLRIHLGKQCPVDVDVGKWVLNAVERFVRELILEIRFLPTADPTSLPKSLYTCKALVKLTLTHKILVDVPSLPCLPSLKSLALVSVVYKDQGSHVRLLSSCPVLRYLHVVRNKSDNVTKFIVKLPSLRRLGYMDDGSGRSLVIDSPGLKYLRIIDHPLGDNISIQNMPCLLSAVVFRYGTHVNDKFLTSLSSVTCLNLANIKIACCSTINFSRLRKFQLYPSSSEHCWMDTLVRLLHNAPKLKALIINTSHFLGTNQVLYRDACCLALATLSG